MPRPRFHTYCSGHTGTPSFPSKAQARAWCRQTVREWRRLGMGRAAFSRLPSGEEHWRIETGATLDCCGFRREA